MQLGKCTILVYFDLLLFILSICRQSASCTHVSALLHALVAVSPSQLLPASTAYTDSSDDELPVTSYKCQWIQPRKRKESKTKMADAKFEKHVYGRERKHSMKPLEEFDPRPPESVGTALENLKKFLPEMQGRGLGVSSLFDPKSQVWKEGSSCSSVPQGSPSLPSKEELVHRVSALKSSLQLSRQAIRDIQVKTQDQHDSSLWHSERRFRITASHFGDIRRRQPATPPDSLVLRILGLKSFSTTSTEVCGTSTDMWSPRSGSI